MKQFNLEDFKAGKPVVTRDGRKVSQLKIFDVDYDYKLAGVVEDGDEIKTWTLDGHFSVYALPSGADLFHPDDEITITAYKGCLNYFFNDVRTCRSIPDGKYKLVKVDE